jgi:hypothetical protein
MRLPRLASLLLFVSLGSCGSSGTEHAGQPCQVAADCYKGLKTPPAGTVVCLTQGVQGGYCTHVCQASTDCCAVEGECKTSLPEVCGPFESTGQQLCFLSCESTVLGAQDANGYCQENANKTFTCRSTGGGAQNKHVCMPSP